MSIHGIGLLVTLDEADRFAVQLDHEVGLALRNLHRIAHRFRRIAPPPSDLGIAEDLRQLCLVGGLNRPQRDLLPGDDLVDQAARLMPIARNRLLSDSKAYVRISLSVCPYSVMERGAGGSGVPEITGRHSTSVFWVKGESRFGSPGTAS